MEIMNYINCHFSDGYDIGTPFEEIIEDYHGEKAKERVLEWERIYGFLTYDNDHVLCSYKDIELIVHLSVWLDNNHDVIFSVNVYVHDNFVGSSEFSTIEEAIDNYKLTIDKFFNRKI